MVTGGDGDADAHAHELTRAWGPVTTCKHSPTWIGATEHTNNTAELTALAELLRWLINDAPSPQHRILLRPDSEYAMGIALGDVTPRENLELTRVVQTLYRCLLETRGGNVGWSHVKGHSDHKWNDLVDELATRGSKCAQGQAGVPGYTWALTRHDGRLWQAWQTRTTTWATDGELRISIHQSDDPSAGPTLRMAMRQSAPLTWAVPPGNATSSIACLYGKDVSEITRVLR